MRKLICLLSLAGLPCLAMAEDDPLDRLLKGQPREVQTLLARIANCNHFAGEEGYDLPRRHEIAAAMKLSKCNKLANDEAKMLKKYKHSKKMLDIFAAARRVY